MNAKAQLVWLLRTLAITTAAAIVAAGLAVLPPTGVAAAAQAADRAYDVSLASIRPPDAAADTTMSKLSSDSVSADGRYVTWTGRPTTQDAVDKGAGSHVYWRDTVAGASKDVTTLAGQVCGHGSSISADGRYVAFFAHLTADGVLTCENQDPQGHYVWQAIVPYVADLQTGQVVRVGAPSAPDKWGQPFGQLALSADGSRVIYAQFVTDGGSPHLFVADWQNGSPRELGVPVGELEGLALSGDGSTLAYTTMVDAWDETPAGTHRLVVVLDVNSGTEVARWQRGWISQAHDGFASQEAPSIDATGRHVASTIMRFSDYDEQTVPDYVAVWDRQSPNASPVAVQAGDGHSSQPSLSSAGHKVAYLAVGDHYIDNHGVSRTPAHLEAATIGGSPVVITPPTDTSHLAAPPVMAGDGTAIAFVSDLGFGVGTPVLDAKGTPVDSVLIATPHDATPPVWPAGAALQASDTTTTSLTLSWPIAVDNNIRPPSYVVSQDGVPAARVDAHTTSYPVTGLQPNTAYHFAITAVDVGDNQTAPLETTVTTVDPGLVRLTVNTPAGDAGPAGGVRITVTDSGGTVLATQDVAAGTVSTVLPALLAGQTVTVATDLLDPTQPYLAHEIAQVTLTEGANSVTLTKRPLPTVTVSGTVTRPSGVPVADTGVAITSTADGRTWPKTTVQTDSAGHYTATVFAGHLLIETVALKRGFGGDWVERDATPGTLPGIDLLLADGQHQLHLQLFTADYGGDYTVQPLDWRTIIDFEVKLTDDKGDNIPITGPDPTITTFSPTLELCANGWLAGLSSTCRTVNVNFWENEIRLDVTLDQVGAITGTLVGPDGAPNTGRWEALLTEVDANGHAYGYGRTLTGYGTQLRVGVPYAGHWRVNVTGYAPDGKLTGLSGDYTVTLDQGELDLGAVALVRNPTAGLIKSVTASPDPVQPGQLLGVRVGYTAPPTQPLKTATVRLGVPVGTSVAADGVTVDGRPATGVMTDGYYEVDLGDIAAGSSGVVRYSLEVSPTATPGTLSALVWLRHDGTVQEPLGSATAQVLGVALYAPKSVATTAFPVRGTAPPGSPVTVREGDTVRAQVTASAGGVWDAQITLSTAVPGLPHTLQASATFGQQTITSTRATVIYDPSFPRPTSITVGQPGGRSHTFDPAQGTAVFTFVYWQDEPVRVSADFASTAGLSNVVAHVGSAQAPMTCSASTCTTDVTATNGTVGDVWIDYDATPTKYASPADIPLPPQDQRQTLLDTPFGRLTVDSQTDNTVTGDIGGQRFRMDTTVTEADAPGDWTPLAGPIPGWSKTETTVSGDDLIVTQSIALPKEWLATQPAARQGVAALGAAAARLGTARALGVGTIFGPASEIVTKTTDFYGLAKPVIVDGALGGNAAPWDRLAHLFDVIGDSGCDAATKASLHDFVDGEGKYVLAAQLGGGVAMTILGAVLGPVTLLGQILNFGVGVAGDFATDAAADYVVNNAYNQVNTVMTTKHCDKPEPNYAPHVVNAHPTYIFDPSGYTYEGTPAQRLPGVTATIQSAPSAEGPWTDWDAAAFGQDNPQVTDEHGAYGWDVPRGWYRVKFTKDGYQDAYSEVLQVLPPHFDINVGLQRIGDPAGGPTTTTVGVSGNAGVGVPGVLLFAHVSPGAPGGTVTFTDGTTPIPGCAERPIAFGYATCVTTFTTPGDHPVTATYSGDTTHTGSQASTLVAVTPTPDLFQTLWGRLIQFLHNLRML